MVSLDEQLLGASQREDRKEVKWLLRAGARLEARTAHQATPLYLTSRQGHAPVASLLLGKGAAVDARAAREHTEL